jgi:cell division protein FtsA
MASKTNLSVVIDIGTSKIAALAGQKTEDGKIEIAAMAQIPSKGVKRGIVFNIDELAAAINQIIDELEKQIEEEITKVNIAIAGQRMKMTEYRGYRFTSDEGVVTRSDLNALYNEAKNHKVEQDYKILHVIPQRFTVDEEITDINPVGITGRKLEASYKLISVPEVQLNNLQKVFGRTGIEIGEITLSPLAISETVLTEDEKEIGAVVLDIGAGTTKLAVYYENVMMHTAIIPFGGSVVTNDIKEGCAILSKWAEKLKVNYGQALGDFADEQKVVTIPGHSGWEPKEISFKSLAFIIQARLEEIIDNVYFQIQKSGIGNQLGSGIVITGGTSDLNNIVSLVKFRSGMDARKAFPVIHPANRRKDFQNQDYLTALGLLKLALAGDPVHEKENIKENKKRVKKRKENKGVSPWIKVVQGVLDYIDDENDDLDMK